MEIIILNHREKDWFAISIDKNDTRLAKIKQVEGRKWSQTNKMWLVPKTDINKNFIKSISKNPITKIVEQSKKKVEEKVASFKKPESISTIIILKGNRIRVPFYPTKEGINYIK